MYGSWCVADQCPLCVTANADGCADENRGYLLEAGFPQTVLALLEGYAEYVKPDQAGIDPLPMSIADLNIVKTAIGVLLNASFGYGKPLHGRADGL